MSDHVTIIEVGPRDGLQNEKTPIPTSAKIEFIRELSSAGLREIEATSFVSPKWVPQLGDAAELWPKLPRGPLYSALVPNMRGLDRALELGVDRIAVFTAASEDFVHKNINMSIAESLVVFDEMIQRFRANSPRGFVRGYVSTIVECPFAGRISPEQVAKVVDSLMALGVDEISLGDTVGVAVPREVRAVMSNVAHVPKAKVAWHFHDTRGTAIANVETALEAGYRRFDSSAAGLGGCPYAPGAGGNLATDDLVYFAERSGLSTGINLRALSGASLPILEALGRAPGSRVQQAVLSQSPVP
ncbi:MAG: hydroxymethylglutaryl-CoA lyase [Fimbriimonadaceae bacterium]|nr:hydroxymethylglutaryl-CoA lyase [Fimbriimonadaceae bacterium]